MNERRYTLLSMLKYNIDLPPEQVSAFLREGKDDDDNMNPFLSVVKNIDDIPLSRTIGMFQDLNDLFILFYPYSKKAKPENSHNNTKRIVIKTIKSKHRKTYRK